MKHFDKINVIKLSLTMPAEWGFCVEIVDERNGLTLQDAVWTEWSKLIENPPEDVCSIKDETCGFDYDTLTLELFNFESIEQFNRSVEWAESQMHRAYKTVCRKNRKNTQKLREEAANKVIATPSETSQQ